MDRFGSKWWMIVGSIALVMGGWLSWQKLTAPTTSAATSRDSAQHGTLGLVGGDTPACGQGQSPIYEIAQVSSASVSSRLASQGDVLSSSVTGYMHQKIGNSLSKASSQSRTVLLRPRTRSGSLISLSSLRSTPGVAAVDPVFPQSSNPALLSCDYTLSDQSADRPLVQAAEAAIASANLASTTQMTSPSAMYLVSDDPLDSSQQVVTVYVAGPLTSVANGAAHVDREIPWVAIVSRSSDAVSWVGSGPS